MDTVNITHIPREQLAHYSSLLSSWRISSFRDFPYLYEGNAEYEEEYLNGFCANSRSVMFRAYCNAETIALLSGLPLESSFEIIQETAALSALCEVPCHDMFYISEVIVHPEYQGRGLARTLMKQAEEYAATQGYRAACFLTVVRDNHDPRKPAYYYDPDLIWSRFGYTRTTITTSFDWPTRQLDGTVRNTAHELVYWFKPLPLTSPGPFDV